ncbi:hypothetical protein, partial [Paenibacillus oryzisoli]|uniref:hypothetical protein n=1 Tax=Paenibacillus oryzisoli TaxID=1850517 RepID=UPI00195AE5CB
QIRGCKSIISTYSFLATPVRAVSRLFRLTASQRHRFAAVSRLFRLTASARRCLGPRDVNTYDSESIRLSVLPPMGTAPIDIDDTVVIGQ